jgi:hypothetical protein
MQANFECLICLSLTKIGTVWLVLTYRRISLKILSHSQGELELISVLPSVYARKSIQLPLCHLHQLLWPIRRRLFANILLPLLIRCLLAPRSTPGMETSRSRLASLRWYRLAHYVASLMKTRAPLATVPGAVRYLHYTRSGGRCHSSTVVSILTPGKGEVVVLCELCRYW